MSNIYHTEPATHGKVLLHTSFGDIDIELWGKECPKACRNFVQLAMEGVRYCSSQKSRVVLKSCCCRLHCLRRRLQRLALLCTVVVLSVCPLRDCCSGMLFFVCTKYLVVCSKERFSFVACSVQRTSIPTIIGVLCCVVVSMEACPPALSVRVCYPQRV